MTESGFRNLCGGVIAQACEDYIDVKLRMEKAFDQLEELQDFFEGEDFEFYNVNGVIASELVKACDEIVERRLTKWRKKRERELAAG